MNNMRKIYDVYDRDTYIGPYTAEMIMELTGCKYKTVAQSAYNKSRIKKGIGLYRQMTLPC